MGNLVVSLWCVKPVSLSGEREEFHVFHQCNVIQSVSTVGVEACRISVVVRLNIGWLLGIMFFIQNTSIIVSSLMDRIVWLMMMMMMMMLKQGNLCV